MQSEQNVCCRPRPVRVTFDGHDMHCVPAQTIKDWDERIALAGRFTVPLIGGCAGHAEEQPNGGCLALKTGEHCTCPSCAPVERYKTDLRRLWHHSARSGPASEGWRAGCGLTRPSVTVSGRKLPSGHVRHPHLSQVGMDVHGAKHAPQRPQRPPTNHTLCSAD